MIKWIKRIYEYYQYKRDLRLWFDNAFRLANSIGMSSAESESFIMILNMNYSKSEIWAMIEHEFPEHSHLLELFKLPPKWNNHADK